MKVCGNVIEHKVDNKQFQKQLYSWVFDYLTEES